MVEFHKMDRNGLNIIFMVFDDITFEDFDQPARNIIVTFSAHTIFSKRSSEAS